MYIRVKTFQGHPFYTLFWALLTVSGFLAGMCAAMGIYYWICPEQGIQHDVVVIFAIVGTPVAIVSFILRALVEKKVRAKMEIERGEMEPNRKDWEKADTD